MKWSDVLLNDNGATIAQGYETDTHYEFEGITGKHGNEIPFSKKACAAYMKRFPEIFGEISDRAADGANFSESLIEEAKETLGEF